LPIAEHHDMLKGMLSVLAADLLESRFGSWPSFHDAEVLALRLDSGQRSDGSPRLEMDVHLFAVDGTLSDGRANFVLHTLVTLRFAGIETLRLDGFGPQNVLDELIMRDLGKSAWSTAKVEIELPSSNGLGGAFGCTEVAVLSVEPYTPGPHSVYS
jgi:hypothetical protein